ncbi:MAG: hypothetical protein ISR65_20200 [Bacteriovoracaceae bacterium]|nr:hypothetical protein [Bacteriovoracaceae bacterium]
MYCPNCLCPTLSMSVSGVVNVIVNDKQRDTGRFIFNTERENKAAIQEKCFKVLEEFFVWYSQFKHKDPITSVEICSSSFNCANGCPPTLKNQSVVGSLIPKEQLKQKLEKLSDKYNIPLELGQKQSNDIFKV